MHFRNGFDIRPCRAAAIEEQPVNQYQKIEKELRHKKPGWWEWIIESVPELAALSRTPQSNRYHAEGDVAVHTRLTVEACASDADPDLLWAALLHDVGKPLATKEKNGKITAHGHDAAGAEIAATILKRLGLPPARRERIVWAVRHHTFHLSWNLQTLEDASRRQRRFIADPRFALLLELLRVDAAASLGLPSKMKAFELYKQLWEAVRKS